ncbi:MAG TPA: ATP-binding protein [Verrucomicrobiae bacterium]|nr:ATP-binding protein [Verrucomicrobiae bacterium]
MIENLLTNVVAFVSVIFPPDGLRVALALALFSTWMVVIVLGCLNLHTGSASFRLWAIAWLYYSMYLATVLGLDERPDLAVLSTLGRACIGISALFMVWGALHLESRPRSDQELALGALVIFVWSYAIQLVAGNHTWISAPTFVLLALSGLAVANFHFKQWKGCPGANVLAASFAVWSLHQCIFFWVVAWEPPLAALEYLVSAVLGFSVSTGLIVHALERARAQGDALVEERNEIAAGRRAAEQELKISEQKYQQLFDSTCDAILLVDIATLRIAEANPAAEQLVGTKAGELTGRPLRDFCPSLAEHTESLLENKKRVESLFDAAGELQVTRADSDQILCEGMVTLVDCHKRPVLQINVREITTRKKMEQQLRQAEKLSALGQLVAGVAHELNNPLAVVMGYAQLLVKNRSLEERIRRDLDKVLHESERAAKIVRNLLTFARPREPHMTMVDVNRIIVDALETREMQVQRANVEVRRRLGKDLPPTMADAGQVEQVVVNLLMNSIQALETRGDKRFVEVATEFSNNRIRITVADNGPGIPDAIMERIFDPFFTTKSPGKGTGLGLSICYSIVEEHKGRILVESKPGKGARFCVELPVAQSAAPARAHVVEPPIPERNPDASTQRVLIVDDEPGIVDVLRQALNEKGYQIDTAGNGTEALSRLTSGEYDLIISDICMPEMSGEKLHAAVVDRFPHLQHRMIFVTGDTVSPSSRNFLERSGVRWLNKPFNISEVDRVVTSTLHHGTVFAER